MSHPPRKLAGPLRGLKNASRRYGKEFSPESLGRNVAWRFQVAREQGALASRLAAGPLDLFDACPICGDSPCRPFGSFFGFPYDECGRCGHLFCRTPPGESAVRSLYQAPNDQEKSIQGSIYLDPDKFARRVEMIAAPKVRHVSQQAEQGGLWVDLGCGNGEILAAAREAGWRTRGLDSDPEELAFARNLGLEVENVYLGPDNTARHLGDADMVSLFNILEHAPNPAELLAVCAQGLRPGAKVALEVPRHPSLSSFVVNCFSELAARHVYPPDHLHVFSENSLGLILEQAGLEPLSVWLFGQDISEALTSLAAHKGEDAGIPAYLAEKMSDLQKAVDQLGLGDIMLVVAEKRG